MIYIIFLFSIVLHELGHILMANLLNVKIYKMRFKIIGISAEFKNQSEINSLKKMLIIICGPFVNLLISFIMLRSKTNFILKQEIVYTNLILFFFNFLPVIPLDGGNVLLCLLNLKYELEKSLEMIIIIGKMVLYVLLGIYVLTTPFVKNIEIAIVIFYLWYLFKKEECNIKWYIKINKNIRKHLNLQKKCAKIPSVIK